MRSDKEILEEIERRKKLGLGWNAAIDLTPEERAARFGDIGYQERKKNSYEDMLLYRLENNLPMSKSDIKEAKRLKKMKKLADS